MFNIRLKCVEFLATRTTQSEIKTLLTSLILDHAEIVSEAAIKALESSATPELIKLIEETRKKQKDGKKKKRNNSYIANV